jgi:serine/threonine protein kinase
MNKKKFDTIIFEDNPPFNKTFFDDDDERMSQDEYENRLIENDVESCSTLKDDWDKLGKYISKGTYGRVFHFGEDLVLKFQPIDDIDYNKLQSFDLFTRRMSNRTSLSSEEIDVVAQKYKARFGVNDKYPRFSYEIYIEDVVDYGKIPNVRRADTSEIVKYSPKNTFYFRNTQNSEYAINHILYSKYGPNMGMGVLNKNTTFSSCFAPTYNIMFCKNSLSIDDQTGYFSVMEKIDGPSLQDLRKYLSKSYSGEELDTRFHAVVDTCIIGILTSLGCFQSEFGFMHNDLKVDNVLVRKIGGDSVFLTDNGESVLPEAVSEWGFDYPGGRVCTPNIGFSPAIIDFGLSCMFVENTSKNSSLKVNIFNDTVVGGYVTEYAPNFFHPAHDILFLLADIFAFEDMEPYLRRYKASRQHNGDSRYPPITNDGVYARVYDDRVLGRRTLQRNRTILDLVEFVYLPYINTMGESFTNFREYVNNDPYIDSDTKLIVLMCMHFEFDPSFTQSGSDIAKYKRVNISDYSPYSHVTPQSCLDHIQNRFSCDERHRNSVTLARYI